MNTHNENGRALHDGSRAMGVMEVLLTVVKLQAPPYMMDRIQKAVAQWAYKNNEEQKLDRKASTPGDWL